MLELLASLLPDPLRLPRRWDGKCLSTKGTIRSSFRLVRGVQSDVTEQWAGHHTAISEGHLWISRASVFVASISPSAARNAHRRELTSLDGDFVVVPFQTSTGAELEWALRSSELTPAIALLGSVSLS